MLDQMSTYDEIALFGLTENGTDDLIIPDDGVLREQIIRETFETLIGGLQHTGLASEIEALAHGLATLLNRRATALTNQADDYKRRIRGLIEAQDGSEVAEMEMDKTASTFETLQEKADALQLMAEEAARCYEVETSRAYVPVTGNRTTRDARATGAIFEAKQLLDKHDRDQADRNKVDGPRIAITGDADANDCSELYRILDQALAKHPDMVLCHKGHQKGIERMAATWARHKKVPQILFRPNWAGHAKAAPFKANDAIIAAKPIGVLIFGGNGVAANLGEKAEAKGIKTKRFD